MRQAVHPTTGHGLMHPGDRGARSTVRVMMHENRIPAVTSERLGSFRCCSTTTPALSHSNHSTCETVAIDGWEGSYVALWGSDRVQTKKER